MVLEYGRPVHLKTVIQIIKLETMLRIKNIKREGLSKLNMSVLMSHYNIIVTKPPISNYFTLKSKPGDTVQPIRE